ncbi:DNA-packaging protein [Tellurirhabdus bombi]|uniref:DNA-packaging protein n=1 Tax=Tellurirhabdus bombi TaxID=2907205 RepID=UPI001F390976|nr:DNA-packaging protein [Tellurirhabdus bombi]
MPAPEGNQFWKIRSKHGRDKLFATPDLLWEAAAEYFEWCDANPWVKVDFKGKDAERVQLPTSRPYTIEAFCLYCNTTSSWFREFRKNAPEDFLSVITRIEEIIRNQKYEGAVVGAYNANIISRDLGLSEKFEQTGSVTINVKRQRKERPKHDGD